MLERLDDTIVAVSSPPGYGSVGIVRLSGSDSIEIAEHISVLSTATILAERPGSTHATGEVLLDDRITIPATFYLFRAPRSYTRQDIVEIHTVGSPAVLDVLRGRLIELGGVQALPGEFTARAFLGGAMDLATVEGVAGVIRARSDTQLRASRRMMDGVASGRIKVIRDELAELLGLVEADIDFVEEPIEFVSPVVASEKLDSIALHLRELFESGMCVERFNILPHILMLGPPNAGKSCLMNRLSGTRRAICAAVAGTTRDVLSAPIRVERGEVMLLDAAGVDGCCDEIAALARKGTLGAAEGVDAVCLVFDLTEPIDVGFVERIRGLAVPRTLVVANKCDLVSRRQEEEKTRLLTGLGLGPVCATSALKGTGIDELRRALAAAVTQMGGMTLGESVLISERQSEAVQGAVHVIERASTLARSAAQTADCADLLAFELREALDRLGTISGEVTTEDLLGQVFANFCIGK